MEQLNEKAKQDIEEAAARAGLTTRSMDLFKAIAALAVFGYVWYKARKGGEPKGDSDG